MNLWLNINSLRSSILAGAQAYLNRIIKIPSIKAGGNSKTKGNSKISIIKLKDINNSRGYKIKRIRFSPNLKKLPQGIYPKYFEIN